MLSPTNNRVQYWLRVLKENPSAEECRKAAVIFEQCNANRNALWEMLFRLRKEIRNFSDDHGSDNG